MARKRRTLPVLLLEDRENLGEVGDVVEVKPGYARNFLLPSGVATLPTADAMRMIERAKVAAAAERARRVEELADLAKSLEGRSITLEERASEEGHLFGSVGATAIVAALAEQDLNLPEKLVALDEPIKELGIFNVPIRLSADTSVEIRVWIVEPSEE
ncbi:MAG: 50S ribosomal protein L9 [Planctomycetota bacterium]|jgi:large subunit ribosomal protein L9